MSYVVTKKEEEIQTLKKFVENFGEKFDPNLIDYLHGEPCDAAYKGTQYQITAGDQAQLAKKRKDIQKHGYYLIMRSIGESNDPAVVIEGALRKKMKKANKEVTLLVDCTFSADYPMHERELLFKKFISEREELKGSWKQIFLVFRDQNLPLTS